MAEEFNQTMETTKAQAKAGTNQVLNEARDMVRKVAEGQKDRACRTLDGLAGALHSAAGNMQDRDQNSPARYADFAANQVERLARTLRDRDWDGLIADAEGFARANPTLFLGGAVLAGFLVGRAARNAGESSAMRSSLSGEHGYAAERPVTRPASDTMTGSATGFGAAEPARRASTAYGGYGGGSITPEVP